MEQLPPPPSSSPCCCLREASYSSSNTYLPSTSVQKLHQPDSGIGQTMVDAIKEAIQPFFKTLVEGQGEVTLHLSALERRLQLVEAKLGLLQGADGGVTAPVVGELPAGYKFPLEQNKDLVTLSMQLDEDRIVRAKMVQYLFDVGGSSMDNHLRQFMKIVMKASLSRQYNRTGRNGKKMFDTLFGLKGAIYETLRRKWENPSDATLERMLGKWLVGSSDRDGGKRHRQELRKERNTNPHPTSDSQ